MFFSKTPEQPKIIIFQLEREKKINDIRKKLKETEQIITNMHDTNTFADQWHLVRIHKMHVDVATECRAMLQDPSRIDVPHYDYSDKREQPRVTAFDDFAKSARLTCDAFSNRKPKKFLGLTF